jgi:hypothetical protein
MQDIDGNIYNETKLEEKYPDDLFLRSHKYLKSLVFSMSFLGVETGSTNKSKSILTYPGLTNKWM